jgi:hypothetical protein
MLGVLSVAACGDNAPQSQLADASKPVDARLVDGASDAPPDGTPQPVVLNANGGFEAGDASGWICNGNAMCSTITTDTHGGSYAGKAITLPNDYSGFRINVLPLMCPTDPTCATGANLTGKTIRFHGFIKPIGAATAIRLVLRWNCPAQAMGGYEWLQNIANPTPGVWNEYMRDFVVPACNYAGSNENLYLYTGTVDATEFHIDDLTIVEAPAE